MCLTPLPPPILPFPKFKKCDFLIIFSCKNPVYILWNKLKFSPSKNSVLDPWSNRRHSPRQHVNYHGIFTGHLCEIHQKILCFPRVFVSWVVQCLHYQMLKIYFQVTLKIQFNYNTINPKWAHFHAKYVSILSIAPFKHKARNKRDV